MIKFIHFIYKLADIHFMIRCIQETNIADMNCAFDFIEMQPCVPLIVGDSPARPVFRATVTGVGWTNIRNRLT